MVEASNHFHGNGVNGSSSSALKSRNAKRRAKKKDQRGAVSRNAQSCQIETEADPTRIQSATPAPSESETTSVIDSERRTKVPRPASIDLSSSLEDNDTFAAFSDVFARFQSRAEEKAAAGSGIDLDDKGEVIYSDDDQMSESDDEESKKIISKRKQRQLRRLTVAELKQLVKKPELVDWEDVTSTDPTLLIHIKSSRNTIPVPPHWSLKRDYLQNKKGIEKPPFQLPSYIAATGIAEMKDALKEKEGEQTLKAKTRERVQPKMGKVNIDYQKLHDAFFRFQTKPDNLTGFGEVYYEGKEFETKFKERKPGDLSDELKEALSIPPLAPPPWLIAMQRFGPPPNYPQLRIPGLNAPIPDGAQWGFHPGGWGRPPMDEFGNPLFGDVMGPPEGQVTIAQDVDALGEPIERERWGELEPEEDESEEEDDTEDEDAGEEAIEDDLRSGMETPMDGLQTPGGFETPGGMQSVASTVPGGLETPDFLELRKGARGREEYNGPPKQLYQVIPERQTAGGKGFLTSDHGYDLAKLNGAAAVAPPGTRVLDADDRSSKRKGRSAGVEVALDASELEGMSESQLAARYEQAQAAARGSAGGDDTNSEDLALLREELQRKRSVRDAKRAAR
jgi:splicing factor 3B subunit 2